MCAKPNIVHLVAVKNQDILNDDALHFKEARKGFFGCYSVCETMKDTKEGYFIM